MMPTRLSVLMLVAVLGLAIWSVYPTGTTNIPGVLTLAVLEGPGDLATERSLRPLADYLAASARRAVELKIVGSLSELHDADLALVPASFADGWKGCEPLAWGKTLAATGAGSRPMYLQPRGGDWFAKESPRVILGDSHSWAGGRGAAEYLREHGYEPRSARAASGGNVYDHREVIAALVHGAYDVAIVREADLDEALESGLVDRGAFSFGEAGEAKPCFALVASPQLASGARRSVRSAALNLDTLRFDRSSLRVRTVLAAMAQIRLAGFVPIEPLPNLRP